MPTPFAVTRRVPAVSRRAVAAVRRRPGPPSARPEGGESSRVVEITEEPRDAAVFNGHDDGLVRVEAALSALGEEAVHDTPCHGLVAMSKLSSRSGRHVQPVSSSSGSGYVRRKAGVHVAALAASEALGSVQSAGDERYWSSCGTTFDHGCSPDTRSSAHRR
jgi:hypothetical protein